MLCKFFEGIWLKNTKTIGNVRMSIGFAGKTVRANKVSGNEGMSICSINGFGVPKICTDPSGKSQTILPARAIWLWLCSLPCVYFGEGILLERKKKIFFRTTFRKKILGHRSINFKHTSVSLIIIFKNFGRCLKHLGKLCNEHSHIPRNFVIFSWTSKFFLITNTKFYWITVQRFSTLEFYINSSGWPRLQCTKRFASSKCMGYFFQPLAVTDF